MFFGIKMALGFRVKIELKDNNHNRQIVCAGKLVVFSNLFFPSNSENCSQKSILSVIFWE